MARPNRQRRAWVMRAMAAAISGYSFANAEAAAFAARLTGSYSNARLAAIDAWFTSIKASPGLTKFDAVYFRFLANSADALLNVIANQYNSTVEGTCTHTPSRGFTTNGVDGSRLNNNFNPTTASSPKFVQDSAHRFGWREGAAAESAAMLGMAAGIASGYSYIFPRFGDNNTYTRLNNSTDFSIASSDGSGFWCLARTLSTEYRVYQGATLLGTPAHTSEAPGNSNFLDMQSTGGGVASTDWTSVSGFGSGLSGAEVTALRTATATLRTAFGVSP